MISKDQFLELNHRKSLGVPTTTIAKIIGISVPRLKYRGRNGTKEISEPVPFP